MNRVAIPKTIKQHRYSKLLGMIWREVNVLDGIVTVVFCGKRGKGKSYSMLEWARILDRGPDDVCRFEPEDVQIDDQKFLEKLIGNYPRGKVIPLDDAGIKFYKSDALTKMLKTVSKILQNIRYKHPLILMSLPSFEQLVKDARNMSDIFVDMQGIDKSRNLAIGKIQSLKVSSFSGDLYRYNILQAKPMLCPKFGIELKHWVAKPFLFDKPPKDFCKEYEAYKKPELDAINQRMLKAALPDEEKEYIKKRNFLEKANHIYENYLDQVLEKGKVEMVNVLSLTENERAIVGNREEARLITKKLTLMFNAHNK